MNAMNKIEKFENEAKVMKVFFDTEFTGLTKDTTLVSIGLIAESGRQFYAEFSDYDKSYVNTWFQENVIDNLLHGTNKWAVEDVMFCEYHYGTKAEIKETLTQWLSRFNKVELVSDVCHYDMVLFVDIFGSSFDLPKNVAPCCHDINQDIAAYYGISEAEAFDKSREEIVWKESLPCMNASKKHNALWDAEMIYRIYHKIQTTKAEVI